MSDPVREASHIAQDRALSLETIREVCGFGFKQVFPSSACANWNHRSAKIGRALLSSPNHPRFSRYNFATSERDKSWLTGP
jgi:hypothetical protein